VRKLKKEVWPYQINLKIHNDDKIDGEIFRWCNESIGHRFKHWFGYSFGENTKLYAFKDEETLLVFKLKWGQYVVR
jgi:hypothetical protein